MDSMQRLGSAHAGGERVGRPTPQPCQRRRPPYSSPGQLQFSSSCWPAGSLYAYLGCKDNSKEILFFNGQPRITVYSQAEDSVTPISENAPWEKRKRQFNQ